jgi:hypothetical protein
LPLKNKTNQLFLPFICCQLGRNRNEKERKEKARDVGLLPLHVQQMVGTNH